MVRGPTPPVVGVRAARSWRARTESARSPLRRPFSEATPASTTTAPGFTISGRIRPGEPVAVTIISKFLSFVKSSP